MSRSIAALLLLVAAAYAATEAQTVPPRHFVVIGCISQQNAKAPFVLTDTRRDPPIVYRLAGDPKQLTLLVGQTVEVAGPVTPGTDKQPPTIKVESLIRISTSCVKAT